MWKLDHRAYRLPFRTVVRTAHGPWPEREGLLLRAVRIDAAGREISAPGWGEAAPIPWFGGEAAATAERALADLRGRAESLSDALARTPAEAFSARAALASALRDDADASVGAAEPVKFLPVAGLLPAGRPALAAIAPKLELGFRTFKWKVGVGDPADELSLLDDLLAELPPGARLRLDANGAWDRRVAERWLAAAADRPMIDYVEQPIAPDARGAEDILQGLAEDYPVKLALDESIAGSRDVERWLSIGWSGVWVIKPALLGEPEPILEKLTRAGADLVFGSALETAVGAASGLRLAFAWADARASAGVTAKPRALGYGVWPLFAETRADAPWIGPFVRRDDLARVNPEALWTALA